MLGSGTRNDTSEEISSRARSPPDQFCNIVRRSGQAQQQDRKTAMTTSSPDLAAVLGPRQNTTYCVDSSSSLTILPDTDSASEWPGSRFPCDTHAPAMRAWLCNRQRCVNRARRQIEPRPEENPEPHAKPIHSREPAISRCTGSGGYRPGPAARDQAQRYVVPTPTTRSPSPSPRPFAVEGGNAAASSRIHDTVARLTEQVTATFRRRMPPVAPSISRRSGPSRTGPDACRRAEGRP